MFFNTLSFIIQAQNLDLPQKKPVKDSIGIKRNIDSMQNTLSNKYFSIFIKDSIYPSVIHIPTHGFFYRDTTETTKSNPLSRAGLSWKDQLP
jgi:hypothetical protein